MPEPLQTIEAATAAFRNASGSSALTANTTVTGEIKNYYHEAQSYLTGPLQGACHFGYTEVGQPFEMNTALRAMETRLGEELNLSPDSIVVDAGCGYGRVATAMAGQFGLNVIGVDLMAERLAEAQRFTEEHGVANKVHLINGSYSEMREIPDASVDAVYTSETLVHANPLEGALKEFLRVLKPGGKVVFLEYSIPPLDSMNPVYRRLAKTMIHNTGMASIDRFTILALVLLARSSRKQYLTIANDSPSYVNQYSKSGRVAYDLSIPS